MQLLLDTHVLLWWVADSPRLRTSWRTAIAAADSRVVVSAASIWEIAIKMGTQRLQIALPAELRLDELAHACGFDDLPIQAAHAAAVRALPPHHTDPFDRVLVAQAKLEQLVLVSADGVLAAYDIELLD